MYASGWFFFYHILSVQVHQIHLELAQQITADFHEAFSGPNAKHFTPNKQLAEACLVVSVLDPKVKWVTFMMATTYEIIVNIKGKIYLTHVFRHHISGESSVKGWNIRSFQPTIWLSSTVDVSLSATVNSTDMNQLGVSLFLSFQHFLSLRVKLFTYEFLKIVMCQFST